MRFVQFQTAGSLVVDLDERPDSGATFVLLYPSGGAAQASTAATRGAADTTIGAAAAGASTVTVASASGIAAGERYLVGGPEASGGEVVTVRSVSGTTVTLVRPLQSARAASTAFQAARVTLSVPALATIARHYRAVLTYAVGSAARPDLTIPFDVTRYVPVSTLTMEDVRDVDHLFAKRLQAGAWWPGLRAQAWEIVLRRIAATKGPGDLVGAVDLTMAHAYAVRELVAETAGAATPEQAAYRDDLRARFRQELEASLAASAWDDDQDNAIEPRENWGRSITVLRG